ASRSGAVPSVRSGAPRDVDRRGRRLPGARVPGACPRATRARVRDARGARHDDRCVPRDGAGTRGRRHGARDDGGAESRGRRAADVRDLQLVRVRRSERDVALPPRRGMTTRSGVAITGVGIVSAAVTGDSAALGAFLAAPVAPPDTAFGAGALAALVDPDEARRLSRVCQLTVTAARLALRESGLERDAALGLVVGTEFGDLGSTHAFADGFLARG